MALREFANMTPDERAECGRKGGIKSGETKRRKKAMKESLNLLLSLPLESRKEINVEELKSFKSLKGKNISVEDALLVAQIQKALRGDTTALQFIRDTSGQKPKDEVETTIIQLPKFEGENELKD